ncbi:MAG: TonB C-terminal domain-containing protein [Zetaproteobacteria bacterium]|nr:MAG: TonB C-terminal domain-containing protein [Zetaproteobacteria bacterium]
MRAALKHPRRARPSAEELFTPLAETLAEPEAATDSPAIAEADAADAAMSAQEANAWIARIRARIERAWRPPPVVGEVRDPLVALDLNPDGTIARIEILESSGHPALDASLVRAIRAAAPFPLPPRSQAFLHNRVRFHPRRD